MVVTKMLPGLLRTLNVIGRLRIHLLHLSSNRTETYERAIEMLESSSYLFSPNESPKEPRRAQQVYYNSGCSSRLKDAT